MSSSSSPQKSSKSATNNQADQHQRRCKVFVSNINSDVPEPEVRDKIRHLFSKYGSIQQFDLKRNLQGQYYFAFVDYLESDSATKAVRKLKDYDFEGRKLRVEYQQSNPRRGGFRGLGNRPRSPPRQLIRRKSRSPRSPAHRHQRRKRSRSYERHPSRYEHRVHHHSRHERSNSRQRERERGQQSKDQFFAKDACYRCGGKGHYARNCPNPTKRVGREERKSRSRDSESSERGRRRRRRSEDSSEHHRNRDRRRKHRRYPSNSSSDSSSYYRRRKHQKHRRNKHKYSRHSDDYSDYSR